ncbi:uncharacterized protein LOC100908453 [Galendromus occidentalis]|uniref:Uncharacterized protein LOC100908453 n=1 Tax=Galendromus occidentalis TaxID=34638 RepID=A0AAJ6VWY5_9ACAR|nr:uncharacterized protein LOC100908453 [Galendromus occidentalis]
MDGTFRVVPRLFLQLYSIHAFYKGQMQALVYFLLPDKSKATYNRVFAMLKEYALSVGKVFQPTTVQLDFEVVCLNAIQESFPGAGVKGCNFHFCQALWRKAQELGLQPYYGDRAVNRFLKCVAALSLVPLEEIDEAWLQIDSDSPSADHPAFRALDRFKTYFISTWLENESVFPRVLWNHYRNFGARTTNHIEGWHHALNGRVGKRHVNLFEIVSHLQKESTAIKLNACYSIWAELRSLFGRSIEF